MISEQLKAMFKNNSEQLKTKSKRLPARKRQVFTKCFNQKTNDIWKVIQCILRTNPKTLKVDPEKLNKFFNKTAEWLIRKRETNNVTLKSYASSLKDKSSSFKLQLVTPMEGNKRIQTLCSNCSTGCNNIPDIEYI